MPFNRIITNYSFTIRDEERGGGFPFAVNTQFKIAIGLTDSEFKFAVNGKVFASFRYRSSNQLSKLSGLKARGEDGIRVQITSLDHITTGHSDCKGFEVYSR